MEKKYIFHWTCCWSLLVGLVASGFRRCPASKRNLIIAGVCFVYLLFVVSQVGYRRVDKYRRSRGLNLYLGIITAARPDPALTGGTGNAGGNNNDIVLLVPTLQSNVVYITLKSSKRLKPAVIRATVKPKLRRKVRRNYKTDNDAFTQNKGNALEGTGGAQQTRAFGPKASWKESSRDIDYRLLHITDESHINTDDQSQNDASSIRMYSQKAPPWFSAEDVRLMRFLADAKAWRIKEVSYNKDSPSVLLFEGDANVSPSSHRKYKSVDRVCPGEQCGIIKRPVDTSEVFAFHLDRVLGLNRTLPAVSRRFGLIHDGQPCAVVSWDPSLYPGGLVAARSTRLTWKEYQSSLKQRCWHKNVVPKLDSGCSSIHHYEWSKVAVFDFLLQIYNRLDRSCCGFRPRQEDQCVETGHHAECTTVDRDHVPLANIVHRTDDPRHLVFTNNQGFFDRNEDNLDFRILEGIRELPEQAVGVLRSRKLRERLLQSLFMDQVYWESQGGRRGIDKLIDVIERRVNVLHTYINAHGIKVIPMNA